jgi:hypothetical protein
MSLFLEIEELNYSIYRIEYVYGQNNDKLPKLILHFRNKFGCIELLENELDDRTVFCERYVQLYCTPAPCFSSKTWDAFKEMLLERAQSITVT